MLTNRSEFVMGMPKSGIDSKCLDSFIFVLVLCLTMPALYFASPNQRRKAKIEKHEFGKLADGTAIALYTLTNRNGLEVQISNYGGAVVSIKTPDRSGRMGDVGLGYDQPQSYADDTVFFGIIVGRYANRIAKGKFALKGVEYQLAQNNPPNHLHGGVRGFGKVIWNGREVSRPDGTALELSYLSKDGEEGYPGNLSVKVTYVVTNANELRIEYS